MRDFTNHPYPSLERRGLPRPRMHRRAVSYCSGAGQQDSWGYSLKTESLPSFKLEHYVAVGSVLI